MSAPRGSRTITLTPAEFDAMHAAFVLYEAEYEDYSYSRRQTNAVLKRHRAIEDKWDQARPGRAIASEPQ
jgi:hypothetical protein